MACPGSRMKAPISIFTLAPSAPQKTLALRGRDAKGTGQSADEAQGQRNTTRGDRPRELWQVAYISEPSPK